MFVLSLSLGFTACSDDDDDDVVDYAAQIAGTYNGDLTVDLGLGEDPTTLPEQDIKLNRNGENKAELVLDNFSLLGMNVGTIKVSDIDVVEKDGTITLKDKSVKVSLVEGTIKADVAVSSSNVKGKTLRLNIDVTNIEVANVAGKTPDVTVKFVGDKK